MWNTYIYAHWFPCAFEFLWGKKSQSPRARLEPTTIAPCTILGRSPRLDFFGWASRLTSRFSNVMLVRHVAKIMLQTFECGSDFILVVFLFGENIWHAALKPMHNIGKVSVNASILYKNQERPTCENFSSFRYFFYEKTVKTFSIFVFILRPEFSSRETKTHYWILFH